jgi:NitT/TauT family transport system substrate-binding protein
MIRLKVAICIAIAIVAMPAGAQERVVIGTQRLTDNGALFLAAAQGYFKAEGIDLAMTAYESDQTVAETLAAGATDFGLAGFTPAAFNFAGKGLIKAVAAQVREKRYYEGTEIVASNIGFNKGLHKFRRHREQDNRDQRAWLGPSLSAGADRPHQTCRCHPHYRKANADA